jgi:anti-anti-sigma factor
MLISRPGSRLAMTGAPGLAIEVEEPGSYLIVRLRGELDLTEKDRLHEVMNTLLEREPRLLVADLSGLAFTDCAGLSVFTDAHRRQAAQGRLLLICGVQPLVRRVLTLTGLDTYLHVTPGSEPDGPCPG